MAEVSQEQLAHVAESLRTEFQAGLSTVGVQLGAVEKTLKERLSSLKAWGISALIGGQTIAAIVAKYVGADPAAPARVGLHALARLVS